MLIDIDENEYYSKFCVDPHPFLSQKFLQLNKSKVDRIIYLVNESSKPSIGLVVGLKNGNLYSPFSAPFGGFHFSHESIYISVINSFIEGLKCYIQSNGLTGIQMTLPPNIYHQTINTKFINCLFNCGFKIQTLDITSGVDLETFNNRFKNGNARTYLNQALNQGLKFKIRTQTKEKLDVYELIKMNRIRMGRPIFMSFDDLQKTNEIWDIDYFAVEDLNNETIASAIFYRAHKSIVYGLFLGDSEKGRRLRAVDFCVFSLWNYYKQYGYKYIDFGLSTVGGHPNEGLLRFKETHEAISSLRYTFSWFDSQETKIESGTKKLIMEPINRYGIILRLVEIEDSEFILNLRTDSKLSQFISPTSPILAEQIKWIENYKIRERENLELYFIAQDNEGNRYGTIRLYNRDKNNFEIGSWLFAHNSPIGMAVKAHIIGYETGYELFNAEYCKFEVRKKNSAVLRYVEFFKPQIVGTDELNVYFQLARDSFYERKNKITAFSSVSQKKEKVIFVHPTAEVQSTMIGEGTCIWQYCVVLKNAKIGKNCNLNYNVFVENDVIIGDNVTVKSGVQLWDGIRLENNAFISPNVTFTNDFKPRSKQYPIRFLNTFVKEGASIGANSTIIGGITIGKFSMIGAGSVVTKNIPDYTLWYGNPATFKANICKCGQKLSDRLICSNCKTEYKLIEGAIYEL